MTALACALAGVLLFVGSGIWKEVIPQFIPEPAAAAPSKSSSMASAQTVTPSAQLPATSAAPKPSVTASAPVPEKLPVVPGALPTSLTLDVPSLGIHIVRQFGSPIQAVDGLISPPKGTDLEKFQVYLETGGQTHLPGSPGDGTFFIDGHTYSDSKVEGAFDDLQPVFSAVAAGQVPKDGMAKIAIPGYILTYRVTDMQRVLRTELPYRTDVYDYDQPGHGRIFACFLNPDGTRSSYNFVMWVELFAVESL